MGFLNIFRLAVKALSYAVELVPYLTAFVDSLTGLFRGLTPTAPSEFGAEVRLRHFIVLYRLKTILGNSFHGQLRVEPKFRDQCFSANDHGAGRVPIERAGSHWD
jgi:hypothetical protein